MTVMTEQSPDLGVLREMIRLAENRRNEEFQALERISQYNLALIAFSGSFLSLLITAELPKVIPMISGVFLIASVSISLIAIRPKSIIGGTLVIDRDVTALKSGQHIALSDYLLETAHLLDEANNMIGPLRRRRVKLTIISAVFLALALFSSYTLFVMLPRPGTTTVGL